MENLDPLRKKPDFATLASDNVDVHTHYGHLGFVAGCEHVWNTHVEPLMKEAMILRQKNEEIGQRAVQLQRDIDDQNLKVARQTDHIRELGSERNELAYNVDVYKDELKTLQSRIRELEEDRDKFAIGFAVEMAKQGWEYIGETSEWRLYAPDRNGWNTKTTAELLELYKESLNQKP